jgi:hypothetical protein
MRIAVGKQQLRNGETRKRRRAKEGQKETFNKDKELIKETIFVE